MAIALGELGRELAGEDAGTKLDLWVGAWMRARGRVGVGGMASGALSKGNGRGVSGGVRSRLEAGGGR
jgi:hypothetical protein